MDLKEEICRRVEGLSFEQQRRLLAYCDAFGQNFHRDESGTALLPFFGTLDDVSAKEMTEAIEAACESIDLREW